MLATTIDQPNEEQANTTATVHTEEHAYDIINSKEDSILRLMYLNINGLPQTKHQPKNQLIHNVLLSHKVDIFGFSETNLNWKNLDNEHQWRERTMGIWEHSHSSIAYNTNDISTSSAFQPGGTLIHSTGKCCHRVISSSSDPSGLGRWCSTKYRGKNDISLRIICAYRPCKPSNPGPSTIYSQHQRYYDEHDDDRCPRKAFLEDLIAQLKTWKDNGEQLILMIDCNEDVSSAPIKNTFRDVGMKEALIHQNNTLHATFHRGSTPIDGIFTSPTINLVHGGYLPFGDFPSDHRALWIDIQYENAFGYRMSDITNPVARRLKSHLPRVRNKFNHDYTTFIRKHHLEERLYSLQNRLTIPILAADAIEYETILNIRTTAIAHADKRCRKVFMGAIPFSVELKLASKRLELWKAALTKKSRSHYSMNKLRRLESQVGVTNVLHLSTQSIKDKLKEAKLSYWKIKKKGDEHRTSFLMTKAEDMANDSQGSPDNIYTQLINREKLRKAHRRVRFIIKKGRLGGITKIDVISDEGITSELTTKTDIEDACIIENRSKYRQTENTPCMDGRLLQELGFLGLTHSATSIADGTFICPDNVHPFANEFFQQFICHRHTLPAPPNIMTTASFKQGWKKMKEATSAASLTGIHFGHLKAASLDDSLADFEAAIANVPYSTGYYPSQWTKSIICMIKKKANVDLVTKLRTIVLTEADFNFNNKKLGKESIFHAEANNLIAKEQYGSRKGKRAIDHALNKRLLYDIIRQSRKPGALCSNDAKSCYDRVLHSITMLAFRRLGFPIPPVECMLRCIQDMKHHIRTTFGDSSTSFTISQAAIPFQGILQGNGAAPTIWVLISTPLLNMLRDAENGAYMTSPISNDPDHIVGFAFVDDTDLVCFQQGHLRLTDEIMQNMQQGIDRWEGGLKLTGGAIVPEKSWIYAIDFTFDETGKWHYKQSDDIDHRFTVQDHNNRLCNLTKIESNEGKETLGVILAPDGNNLLALENLCEKAQSWSDHVRTSHLSSTEARLALDSTIMKTLTYPLPALTLTEPECNKIMKPILDAALAKTRISRSFPHYVLYGPKSEKGLGFANLYMSQGISHVNLIQHYLDANDNITGSLLRNSIESLKLELGVGTNIFLLNYEDYHHHATDCWIKDTWKFAHEHDIDIIENVTPNLTLRRQHDSYIMEEIINLSCYSGTELKHINRCRLFLQVTTLADITSACGSRFSPQAYNCIYDDSIPHHYLWPTQTRPYNRSRRLWKQAIKRAFPRQDHILLRRLGPWNDNARDNWQWFYQPSTSRLFRRHNGRLKLYLRTSRFGAAGRHSRYSYCTQAISLPDNAHRASIRKLDRRHYVITGVTRIRRENLPTPTDQTERETNVLRRLSLQESYSMHNVSLADLERAIRTNSLRLVSDGSYLESASLGTAAWVLAISRHRYATGDHITPGPGSVQCSHRSELSGMLGAILQVNDLCLQFQIDNGSIELQCDGLGAVNVVKDAHLPINPSYSHFDIITSITIAISRSPLTWTFNHVKGHRDDEVTEADLNDWEFWNTIADRHAKCKLSSTLRQPNWLLSRPIYSPYIRVLIHRPTNHGTQEYVVSKLSKTCTDSILSINIRKYWQQKRFFTEHSKSSIDWLVARRSSSCLPLYKQVWLSKWTTGICGVGKWLQRWKWQPHSDCPRCGQPDEDVTHVLLCNEITATSLWTSSIADLEEWLELNDCEPDMKLTICLSLQSWHNGSPLPTILSDNPLLQLATRQQDNISWFSFICGFLAVGWRAVQHEHLLFIGSQKSSILWMTKLQRRIWIIPWSLWLHRNNHLHNDGSSIHRTDYQSVVSEILREWNLGIDTLPPRYQHLFQGTVQQRLNENIHLKLMWLASVWAARDRISRSENLPVDPNRNTTAISFFIRWRQRAGHDP